jgi:hypothetical protein
MNLWAPASLRFTSGRGTSKLIEVGGSRVTVFEDKHQVIMDGGTEEVECSRMNRLA